MTFDQLLLFMEVANCKSFTKAAERCYVSQPNLTKLIAKLEKELDVKLFERTTQKVELTPAGEFFMSRAKTHFVPLYKSLQDIRDYGSSFKYTFNIGVTQGEQIPEPLTELLRQQNLAPSDLRYFLQEDSNPSLLPNLLTNRYDLLITSEKDTYSNARVRSLTLRNFQFRLAISKNHPVYSETEFSIASLRNETIYFVPPQESATHDLIGAITASLGVMAKVRPTTSSSVALNNVQLCTGAALLTGLLEEERYPDVAFLKFEERKMLPKQCLVWRADETNPHLLELIEATKALFP